MSAHTVIASGHGPTLYLAPYVRPRIDRPALDKVLARYELHRLEDGPLPIEFVVSRELDAHDSAALARDLRAIGLVVRVVPRGDITISARISQALLGPAMIGSMLGLGLLWSLALIPGVFGPVVGITLVCLVGLHALVSFTTLVSSTRMPLVAARLPENSVVRDVSDLVTGLPETVARPLLERARDLEARARRNPDGAAARELEAMRSDLADEREQLDETEARSLRRDLAQARAAMREAGRHER
ncbi:MAG: hypothetical protein AAF211_21245 [Myxococcota bacterium]